MNGPEGFFPKKQNFTMQLVQVLWYCPHNQFLILVLHITFSFFLLTSEDVDIRCPVDEVTEEEGEGEQLPGHRRYVDILDIC